MILKNIEIIGVPNVFRYCPRDWKSNRVCKRKDIYNLSIDSSSEFISGLKKGASVSVNGVCLTVKDANPEVLRFDLVEETIKKNKLSKDKCWRQRKS